MISTQTFQPHIFVSSKNPYYRKIDSKIFQICQIVFYIIMIKMKIESRELYYC